MLITYLCITYIRTFEAPLRSQLRSLLGERQVSKLGAQKQELPLCVSLFSSGCEACLGSSYCCFGIRWSLELDKDTHLSIVYVVYFLVS